MFYNKIEEKLQKMYKIIIFKVKFLLQFVQIIKIKAIKLASWLLFTLNFN